MLVTSLVLERDEFIAQCWAPDQMNLSLKDLYTQDQLANNVELAEALAIKLKALDSVRAYGPTAAAMSGRIALRPQRAFVDQIRLPLKRKLYRNKAFGCEGTVLRLNESLVFSAKGCLLLVASGLDSRGEPFVIGAHAGRDSLIDRKKLDTGERSREHFSVVHAMSEAVWQLGAGPRTMKLYILFSISADELIHELDHSDEKMKKGNERMRDYLKRFGGYVSFEQGMNLHVDIAELAKAQASTALFGDAEILRSIPTGGPFSTTRHPDQEIRNRSNLVLLTCTR